MNIAPPNFFPTPVNTHEVEVHESTYTSPVSGLPNIEYSIRYKGVLAGAVTPSERRGAYLWLWDMSDNPDDLRFGDAQDLKSAVNKVLQLAASYLAHGSPRKAVTCAHPECEVLAGTGLPTCRYPAESGQ
jgi:hypothetical protein